MKPFRTIEAFSGWKIGLFCDVICTKTMHRCLHLFKLICCDVIYTKALNDRTSTKNCMELCMLCLHDIELCSWWNGLILDVLLYLSHSNALTIIALDINHTFCHPNMKSLTSLKPLLPHSPQLGAPSLQREAEQEKEERGRSMAELRMKKLWWVYTYMLNK